MNYYISKSTLNVNGFNSSIKMHTVAGWVKKKIQDSSIYYLQRLISALKTNIGASEKNGRWYSKQMDMKRRWE